MDDRVVAALAALVAYILWRRGIIQSGWNALWGKSDRQIGTAAQSFVLGAIASGQASDAANRTAAFDAIANNALPTVDSTATDVTGIGGKILAAEPAGLSATIKQYGSDLYNWCLAFVNKTRQQAGLPIGPYGAGTAAAACSALSLHPGVAPAGASVCFGADEKSPNGHIGIAQGGDSYLSAGLIHGGTVTRPYVNNPAYVGWSL